MGIMVSVFGKKFSRMIFVVRKSFKEFFGIVISGTEKLEYFAETKINGKSIFVPYLKIFQAHAESKIYRQLLPRKTELNPFQGY